MSLENQITFCSRCIFSKKSHMGEKACDFGLLQYIKPNYPVKESPHDGFNIIEQYRCLYAFAKNVYEDNKESLGTIEELKTKIINNNLMPYTLCVYIEHFDDISSLHKIREFTILPKHIAIIGKDDDISLIQSNLEHILPPNISWKCNGFLIETDIYDMLQCGLSTNNIAKQIPYIWFTNANNIHNLINHKIVELINHMIYVEHITSNVILYRKGPNESVDNSGGIFGSFLSIGLWQIIRSYKANNVRSFRDIIKALQQENQNMDISEYAY